MFKEQIQQQEAVREQLAEAAAICQAALSEPEMAGLAGRLPGAPADAKGWFQLLSGYAGNVAAIRRMNDALNTDSTAGLPGVERYAVLQALTVALPRVNSLALTVPLKREIAGLAAQVAQPGKQWQRNFAAARMPFMGPMAAMATLREFPAGELTFNFCPYLSYAWPLRFPPRAVPGFLLEMAFGLKGWGPVISPHINRWRRNPLIFQKIEVERSLWRMAKTLELRPDVKFLMGDSWFYSANVSQVSPHLTWLRGIYEDAGAYIVDMEPADEHSGFIETSHKRAELHKAGAFNPRRTLALWRREDMLAWAAQRMDLAGEGEFAPSLPAAPRRGIRIRSPRPARPAKHNSPFHLWNGLRMLSLRPRLYVLLVLILPALAIAAAAGATAWWAAAPGFVAAFIAAWLIQYYVFQ